MNEQELNQIRARRKALGIERMKIYPNPMRTDGVFVVEDKTLKTSNKYSAFTRGAWGFQFQMPYEKADFFANAPTDIDALLDYIDELQARIEELKEHD